MSTRKILIDCDTGIDDSVAILYALKSPHIHVEGIVTGFGNTNPVQAADNSLRLIKLADCGYEVPVVIGAKAGLNGECDPAPEHIHGKNGIGNVILPESSQKPLDEDAADFIIRKANEPDGELIIVTLGRLTNLARALEKDPKLPKKVKKLVTMGGCLHAPGNVSGVAEANIFGDAEASARIIKAGFHMTLVGLDVTTKTYITAANLEELERHATGNNKKIVEYLKGALSFYFEFYRKSMGLVEQCVVHDPLAMVIAEDATLAKMEMIRARVEYENEGLRGMIVCDHRFASDWEQDEVGFCCEVDSVVAVRHLLSVFQD